eukprot:12105058-Alexandrium_andersonii.AAC.1
MKRPSQKEGVGEVADHLQNLAALHPLALQELARRHVEPHTAICAQPRMPLLAIHLYCGKVRAVCSA